ncbi:SRPBCC family protein [Mycobacterium sp.]|uniref:SRPBCC family protein n=1 Tax=Mycobacterium sp. TaxID=1785 RepID=UPI002B7BCA41|nr:SRPBCC family protein [Mycobacterium sp.]HTY32255.1 SRPBCC family protein [Mycobacterium sp.]
MANNAMRRTTEAAALLGLLYGARQYYRNWGATKAECRMVLPGDRSVPDPAIQTTEAVYIDAPVSAVWSELLRAAQRRRDDDSHPESQPLAVGDVVRVAPEGWMGLPDGVTLTVAELVAGKYLVLNATRADLRWNAVWSFHVQPHWEDRVRLLTRARIALRHPGEVFAMELARPVIAMGTRALLLGIKNRVERSQMTTPTEEAVELG